MTPSKPNQLNTPAQTFHETKQLRRRCEPDSSTPEHRGQTDSCGEVIFPLFLKFSLTGSLFHNPFHKHRIELEGIFRLQIFLKALLSTSTRGSPCKTEYACFTEKEPSCEGTQTHLSFELDSGLK